ncbi:MAG: hypothetical protein WKF35_03410 [Ferruginibacter sp.]
MAHPTLAFVATMEKSLSWMYEEHLTTIEGGGSFGIRSIIEDKEGKFWFCNTKYRYTIFPGEIEKGLINKHHLWMATYGFGVWLYDGKKIIHYPVKDDAKNITLFSIYKDNLGMLWLGTHEGGAYTFNGKTFEKFKP